jgi:hypothetical protein
MGLKRERAVSKLNSGIFCYGIARVCKRNFLCWVIRVERCVNVRNNPPSLRKHRKIIACTLFSTCKSTNLLSIHYIPTW